MEGSDDTCAVICIPGPGECRGALVLARMLRLHQALRYVWTSIPSWLALRRTRSRSGYFTSGPLKPMKVSFVALGPANSHMNGPSALNDSRPLFEGRNTPAVTTVPVRFIITRDLRQWDYALCVFSPGIRFQSTT